MLPAAHILDRFQIPYEPTIVSAHHTPDRLVEYARSATTRGLWVVFARALRVPKFYICRNVGVILQRRTYFSYYYKERIFSKEREVEVNHHAWVGTVRWTPRGVSVPHESLYCSTTPLISLQPRHEDFLALLARGKQRRRAYRTEL